MDVDEDTSKPSVEARELTREVVTNLRNRGLRLTPQRLLILELLQHASGHIAPEDVYQQVLRRFPMINRSTVYRTLDMLEELGFVRHGHVEDGAARYHLAGEVHHVHLICHECGGVIDVTDLGIAGVLTDSLADHFGFQADLTHFPISGLCRGCAGNASPG